MAQQLANLQTDARVSYGNDALMPDQEFGDGQTDPLPQEDTLGGVGFIHPESFNQQNTENQGAYLKKKKQIKLLLGYKNTEAKHELSY